MQPDHPNQADQAIEADHPNQADQPIQADHANRADQPIRVDQPIQVDDPMQVGQPIRVDQPLEADQAIQADRQGYDLRHLIGAHERRLLDLREALQLAEEEVELHEVLLNLARNERIEQTLGSLLAQWELSQELASDPIAFCRSRGITLPEGVRLNAVELDERESRLAMHLGYGNWNVEVMFDREGRLAVMPRRGQQIGRAHV